MTQQKIINANELCFVETAHKPLCCDTFQALVKDRSMIRAAIGETKTGGRFS